MPTKDQIREKLETDLVYITEVDTNVIATTAEKTYTYVVGIIIDGDGVSSRLVDIKKGNEDGSVTKKIDSIYVGPSETKQLPVTGLDVENPFISLEGGTSLKARVQTAGVSLCATVVYWKDQAV